MPRKSLLGVALVAAFASPAAAQHPQTLAPGVTFERQVQFTPYGAVAIDVLTAPRPGGLYELPPFGNVSL